MQTEQNFLENLDVESKHVNYKDFSESYQVQTNHEFVPHPKTKAEIFRILTEMKESSGGNSFKSSKLEPSQI